MPKLSAFFIVFFLSKADPPEGTKTLFGQRPSHQFISVHFKSIDQFPVRTCVAGCPASAGQVCCTSASSQGIPCSSGCSVRNHPRASKLAVQHAIDCDPFDSPQLLTSLPLLLWLSCLNLSQLICASLAVLVWCMS